MSTEPIRPGAVRPLVIAHRGASAYRPENTPEAFALAIEQRCDMIETDLRYPDRIGEIYSFAYSEAHRWLYFPTMRPDETMLLKCYDSALDGPARFTAHCAFDAPDSAADAPVRESIEVRTLAFFDS